MCEIQPSTPRKSLLALTKKYRVETAPDNATTRRCLCVALVWAANLVWGASAHGITAVYLDTAAVMHDGEEARDPKRRRNVIGPAVLLKIIIVVGAIKGVEILKMHH